jgi:hypothetical protein
MKWRARRIARACSLALVAFAASIGVARAAIPASERAVLVELHSATGGPGWTTRTNWGGAPGTE